MNHTSLLARDINKELEQQDVATDQSRQMGGEKMTDLGADQSKIWERAKKRLWASVGEDVFSSWFASMELEEIRDGVAHLSVPTRFLSSWITSNYQDRILEPLPPKQTKWLNCTSPCG